ncbi:MAG: PilZ domain-containing protein [Deltaproteobacteria bacterium]|nr:PilZ domain-containing protein [Deltaproteobacteria bacterium]
MDERRAHRRGPALGNVSYEGSSGLRCEDVYDLSAGGMRLVLSGPETAGTDVELKIEGEVSEGGEEKVMTTMRGRVVWARQASPFQVGVRFLDADRAFFEALSQHP